MTTKVRQRSRAAASKQAARALPVQPVYDPEPDAVLEADPAYADRLEREQLERELAAEPGPRQYYRACRRLKIGDKTYERGDEVPEAMSWPRIDTWVTWRRVELVEA